MSILDNFRSMFKEKAPEKSSEKPSEQVPEPEIAGNQDINVSLNMPDNVKAVFEEEIHVPQLPVEHSTESSQERRGDMNIPTPDDIRAVLQEKVHDPELFINIVDIGLVYGIEVTEERAAEVTMTLTSPGCPAGPEIITNVQKETRDAFPDIEEVNVNLVWTPFWNPEMMSEEAKDELGIF